MFTPAGIAEEIRSFTDIVRPCLPLVGNMAGVKPEQIASAGSAVDALAQSAAAFAETDQVTVPLIDRIQADANAVLGKLAALPLPPSVALPVRIAQMMLPVAIAAATLLLSHQKPA